MGDSWLPLFAMYNVLDSAETSPNIKEWAINTFRKFEFHLDIDYAFDNMYFYEEYPEQFNPLKLTLFPKVQSVIRSLTSLFKVYSIEYSIKLFNVSGPDLLEKLYIDQFKEAEVKGNAIEFGNNNQKLITDFFEFV